MVDAGLDRPSPRQDARRFLTFRLDSRLYALPAEEICEIIRVPAFARIPQSPKGLLGMANLRGSVIPLTSLRGLLGYQESGLQDSARAIVLSGTAPVAVAVDFVEALVSPEGEMTSDEQLGALVEPGELLRGAFHLQAGRRVAKILDLPGLLDAAFAQRDKATKVIRAAVRTEPTPAALGSTSEQRRLLSFEVAGQEFSLDLAAVQEILPIPTEIVQMPRTETLVLGVIALRESLLPLLSLRGLLGFPAADSWEDRSKVIVASVAGALVGIVPDRVIAIVNADVEYIDPIPSVLAARSNGEAKIDAIFRGEDGKRLISILSPDQLFREDTMRRLQNDVHAAPALLDQTGATAEAEMEFLVFRLGDEEFGLPIQAVDEVARIPEQITRIPKTPKFLEGVVNMRGEVLPVIDQRRRFNLPKFTGEQHRRRLVVVRTQNHQAGLIVDGVSEVLRVARKSIDRAPDLTDEIARLIHGVINLGSAGRMILLLDPPELLTRTEHSLLDKFDMSSMQEGS